MLEYVKKRQIPGELIPYCIDGKLFNVGRLRANTKVTTKSNVELQYPANGAVCTYTEAER